MTSTHHFSFGDLKVGEKFVFFNPFFHTKPNLQQENMVKISPRRYQDATGNIWHCTSKTGVARLKLGNLYKIQKCFWMVYPSKDIAGDTNATIAAETPESAAYWSKQYNCNIIYISPNDIFCLIEENGEYLKILTTNGEMGWIIYPENEEWTKGCIEELKE